MSRALVPQMGMDSGELGADLLEGSGSRRATRGHLHLQMGGPCTATVGCRSTPAPRSVCSPVTALLCGARRRSRKRNFRSDRSSDHAR